MNTTKDGELGGQGLGSTMEKGLKSLVTSKMSGLQNDGKPMSVSGRRGSEKKRIQKAESLHVENDIHVLSNLQRKKDQPQPTKDGKNESVKGKLASMTLVGGSPEQLHTFESPNAKKSDPPDISYMLTTHFEKFERMLETVQSSMNKMQGEVDRIKQRVNLEDH